jgi:hypothetical protein
MSRAVEKDLPPRRKIGQKKLPTFQNPWLAECSKGARRGMEAVRALPDVPNDSVNM